MTRNAFFETTKSAWKTTVFIAVVAVIYKNYKDLANFFRPKAAENVEVKRREAVLQARLSALLEISELESFRF